MFYERLHLLCKQHGTTITEMSVNHLGVSNSTATSWKKGAAPRSDVVVRAARHFGVTTDYLLGFSDDPGPSAQPSPAVQEVQALAAQLLEAAPVARNAALASARAILQAFDESERS